MKYTLRIICILLVLVTLACQISCTDRTNDPENSTTTTKKTEEEKPLPEFVYDPIVPKAKVQATSYYKVSEPASFSDKLTLATLQGLVANLCEDQILITGGAINNYSPYLKKEWNCKAESKVDGKSINLENLMAHYKDKLSGYILCDSSSESDSGNVAISIAGLLSAVVVTSDNKKICDDIGLTCIIDVTDKDDGWLRASEYWDRLSKKTAFEQPLSMAPKLVDLAVMSGSYFSFYNGHNRAEHGRKYSFLDGNGIVFGYNNTLGEYDTVYSFSEQNLQMIPSDHAYNLSTLSGFKKVYAEQKTKEVSAQSTKNVHTVCIIISDGDNLQWLTNDFTTSNKWWANPYRGKTDIGWGLPATVLDADAPMASYLYDKMSERDEFVMQLSGLGYTFPSKWSKDERDVMASKLSEYMIRSDMHYAEILDDNGFNKQTLSSFTKQEGIDGLFYIDYSNYAKMNGRVIWSNGKPCVAARYRLWANTADGSIEAISKSVNRASTDPTDADAYSFIIVHAWSGMNGNSFVEGGNTMDAVKELVKSFDSEVEVVTPSEFMNRITVNNAK